MIGYRETGKSLGKWRDRNELYSHTVRETLFPRIIDSFQKAMKLRVHVIPVKEKREVCLVDKGGHPFCEMIQTCLLGKRRCLKEISRAVQIAAKIGEPYIFQCHAGMIEFIATISNNRQKTYAFLCGPMLLRHPDSIFVKDVFAKVQDLSIDPSLLMQIVSEIPIFSERRVQAAADLLFMIANYFSRMDSAFQRQKHDMARQQTILAEELFIRKKSENGVNIALHK